MSSVAMIVGGLIAIGASVSTVTHFYEIAEFLFGQEQPNISDDFKGVLIRVRLTTSKKIEYILIEDNNPQELLKEIKLNPKVYIHKYYNSSFDIMDICSIIPKKNIENIDLMWRVAHHLKLDTKNIKTYDQLCNYIDNHIKYSPPPVNDGYIETINDFSKRVEE